MLELKDTHQHDGRSVAGVRIGGDARRAGGRDRRQARRAGREVPGSRVRGRTSPTASTPWRPISRRRSATSPTCYRRCRWRSYARRSRSTCRAEFLQLKEHHQHDGRSAQRLRVGEVTRVAREVGHRRPVRRAGASCRAWRAPGRVSPTASTRWPSNLTAQVRDIAEVTTAVAGGDLVEEDHGRCPGEILELKRHHQHDGGSVGAVRRRRSYASHARSVPRANSAGRRWWRGSAAHGRT